MKVFDNDRQKKSAVVKALREFVRDSRNSCATYRCVGLSFIHLNDGGDRSLDSDRRSGSGGNGSSDGGGAIKGSGEVSAINKVPRHIKVLYVLNYNPGKYVPGEAEGGVVAVVSAVVEGEGVIGERVGGDVGSGSGGVHSSVRDHHIT